MSKQLKSMTIAEYSKRLKGVSDAVLVDVIGLNSANTYAFRKQLRDKKLNLLVVKSSLALRATEGSNLTKAFEGIQGSMAVVWGGEDFVSLAKEMVELHKKPEFEKCQSRGAVMDGECLSPAKLEEVSKWPNRTQQISMLLGQILAPGANLLSQINAPGGRLLSQIKKKSEGEETEDAAKSE